MAFEYYDVEDQIVAQLQQFSSLFDAVVMPESDSEYDDAVPRPRVTVAFSDSKNQGPVSVGMVAFDEQITIDCLIQSRSLRGNDGCHHICKLLKQALVGYELPNGHKLSYESYQKNGTFYDAENKVWNWVLSLTVSKRYTQEVDPQDVPGALLQEVIINDQIFES